MDIWQRFCKSKISENEDLQLKPQVFILLVILNYHKGKG